MSKFQRSKICWLFVVGLFVSAREAIAREEGDFQTTSIMFTDSLPHVVSAISRAFGGGAYHGKALTEFPYDYVVRGPLRIAVPRTNVWNLERGGLPLTLVHRGGKMVAYDEGFEIRVEVTGPEKTKVGVTPTESGTTEDWYSISPHFARVLGEKYRPPLLSETINVFCRIKRQLVEIRAGRTNALPPTFDTTSNSYLHFWKDMRQTEKHDHRNWDNMVQDWQRLQKGDNPQAKLDR